MKNQYQVHTTKFIIYSILLLTFLPLGIYLFILGYPIHGAISTIISLYYGIHGFKNGATIQVNESGIKYCLFGLYRTSLSWSQISEVGLVGINPFNKRKPEKTGALYIYFSKEKLCEEDRFNLILKWPPYKLMYVSHTPERLEVIQAYWSNTIETYNIGNLMF